MTTLQKLPKNVGYLDNLIVAKGFKKLPEVQKIAHSRHTVFGQRRDSANFYPSPRKKS